ncbi:MAG: hypothetical protein U1E86_19830 [Burkholderiaceae bacterium]
MRLTACLALAAALTGCATQGPRSEADDARDVLAATDAWRVP